MTDTVLAKRDCLEPVSGPALAVRIQQYFAAEQDVRAVYLFGSHARHDASRRSDVDLAVVADGLPERFLDRLLLYPGLFRHLGAPVDLLVYTPQEWLRMQNRALFQPHLRVWPVAEEAGGAA